MEIIFRLRQSGFDATLPDGTVFPFPGHCAAGWSHSVDGSKSCNAGEGGEATGEREQGANPVQNKERRVGAREIRGTDATGGTVTLGQGRASWHCEEPPDESEGVCG